MMTNNDTIVLAPVILSKDNCPKRAIEYRPNEHFREMAASGRGVLWCEGRSITGTSAKEIRSLETLCGKSRREALEALGTRPQSVSKIFETEQGYIAIKDHHGLIAEIMAMSEGMNQVSAITAILSMTNYISSVTRSLFFQPPLRLVDGRRRAMSALTLLHEDGRVESASVLLRKKRRTVHKLDDAIRSLLDDGYRLYYDLSLEMMGISTTSLGSFMDFSSSLPSLSESEACMLFAGENIHALRRKESESSLWCKDAPGIAKAHSYSNVLRARRDEPVMAVVAASLGVSQKEASSLCSYYGVKAPGDVHSVNARVQMKNYKESTGYGSPAARPEVRRRIERTTLERYGVDNIFKSEDVQRRIKETNIERYGVSNPLLDPDIKKKALNTMTERYGAATTLQSNSLRERVLATTKERYGYEYISQSPEYKRMMEDRAAREGYYPGHSPESLEKRRMTNLERYGVPEAVLSPEVQQRILEGQKRAFGGHTSSVFEDRLIGFLSSMGLSEHVDYERDVRSVITPKELDFVFSSRNIAIEVSPSYTHHSNITGMVGTVRPKPESYHYEKYKECLRNGITLITLSERNFDERQWGLTKDFLRFKLLGSEKETYYGRHVVIREAVSKEERHLAMEFLRKNHFSGDVPSKQYLLVFVRKSQELVGVASLRSVRENATAIELSRLAWKTGVQVRYGLSKIVSFIAQNYDYSTLVSFSSNDMGHGDSYEKAGFDGGDDVGAKLTFVNPRNPFDTYSWQVATSWSATSGVIASLIEPMDVTNREARELVETVLPHRTDNGKGYLSVYDSGNRKWSFDLAKVR